MRILVTGANGQLGRELTETLRGNSEYETMECDLPDIDITDFEKTKETILVFAPTVIINCAAYTNVDGCESDYFNAYNVNTVGARNISRISNELNAKMVHISTDFVFGGEKESPYFEFDATYPSSAYGKTKLSGEWAVRNECRKHFIVRTSWLYGKYGNNFVKTMIKLGKSNNEVKVVTDQIGTPTLATDLIGAIIQLMKTEAYGTYHYSNSGACSWYAFAQEIFSLANIDKPITGVNSMEFTRPAKRPAYSVMDHQTICAETGIEIRPWQTALTDFFQKEKIALGI